jgi:nucleotide-binding universal stress UspA family protein
VFRTILVPLDGSNFGEFALPLAMAIARRSGATLRLVRVNPPLGDTFFWAPQPGTSLETQLRDHFRAAALAYLENIGRRLASAGAGPVTYAVMEGEVGEAIRAHIARDGTNLVVMSAHGRGAMGRFWLGSVADELIRSLEVPVLLVRPGEADAVPDLRHETVLRHILLALDGTPLAERMLPPARAIGKAMNADYTLVRVIGSALALRRTSVAGSVQLKPALIDEVEKIEERLRREAEDYLQRVAERLRAEGLRVQTRVLLTEHPSAGILDLGTASADLIALETHGRHGLSRLLMGSVADKVIRGSSLPVLVCRA